MNKVICIGESLIDFLPNEGAEPSYTAKAGGAPSNVCACVAKLGGRGYYLGKLSRDVFSRFLLSTMQANGVNTDYVVIDERYPTALAFVSLDEHGDREFSFYRKESCDLMLDKSEIKSEMFERGDILHFCSVGLVESPSKYAHIRAIELAKEAGCTVSFDVNVRLNLWDSEDNCIKTILEFLPYADVVKVTDDELVLLTGVQNEQESVKKLLSIANNAKLLFVTKGKHGVTVYDRSLASFDREAVDVKVVDTTGAGDCFTGCTLYKLIAGEATLTLDDIREAVDFASYGCGAVITKRGAIGAMPTQADIEHLMNEVQ